MNFGTIDRIMLFGKGQVMADFILKYQDQFELISIIGPKHSTEKVEFEGKVIAISEFLDQNGVKNIITERIKNNDEVKSYITKSTLGMSFGSIWIFKEDFIDLFDGKLLNIHGAKLPQDRGGAVVSWSILRNERFGYCLIHQVNKFIDKDRWSSLKF